MKTRERKIIYFLRILISGLFILSAISKLYPTPMFGITKVFEEGQLIPMGLPESLVPYVSRFIIGAEIFFGITILFNNYLKKIILPLSFLMISIFSIHLTTQLFGQSENCGCFGDLIPMTPIEALIKNIITLLMIFIIYKKSENQQFDINKLFILFLLISTIMFASLPISNISKTENSSFIDYVDNDSFMNLEGYKILSLFDPECGHCQKTARSIDSLSKIHENFPHMHIIFSNTDNDTIIGKDMQSRIDNFFEIVGGKYTYQSIPEHNYDTEEIDSYFEITVPNYDNPVVILYDGKDNYDHISNIQIMLYEGSYANSFNSENFIKRLYNK